MKRKFYIFFIPILIPFSIVVATNEIVRLTQKDLPYRKYGINAINSVNAYPEKCSWKCHNDTNYCKEFHVKYLKSYFDLIDKFYFGIINLLKSTGNYVLANIIVLVFIWPLIMYLLYLKCLLLEIKIKQLKEHLK